MLKPNEKWNWYYSDEENCLMLDFGDEMMFRTHFNKNVLVANAFTMSEFTVDDAAAFEDYKEQIAYLELNELRQLELCLYCTAAKRFYKPIQPKSWFFDRQSNMDDYQPKEGDFITLTNSMNKGLFIIVEAGDSASLCILADLDSFALNNSKQLNFGQPIKVMHDRMAHADFSLQEPIALVS